MMTILVTGAAGFIGTNFVYYYLKKYQNRNIIGLDNLTYAGNAENFKTLSKEQQNRFKFIRGDISDPSLLKNLFNHYEIDGIINFAAESHVDRSINNSKIFIKTNVLGTHTLLESAKNSWFKEKKWLENNRFIQISTDEVYGSLGQEGYFTETTPLDPHNPYSASKAAADLFVKAMFDTYGMNVNITRCSNNYGPYQFPEKLIPLMIHRALAHKPLPVYGDGKQIRDWIFVEDHCRGIDFVFENGRSGEVYNIGANNEWQNINLVKLIIEILNNETEDPDINDNLIQYVPDRLGHDRRYAIDSLKIRTELGWLPKVSFQDGICQTIRWYLNNQKIFGVPQ